MYAIGEPTDEEQLYLELINRARANPIAEAELLRTTADPEVLGAYAYFNVDLNMMAAQFAALGPVPPLSLNARLSIAARLHSQDMLANNFQGHTSSTGSNPGSRISAQGYNWVSYGENVYAASKSVWHGHAGFEVDWGNGPGGMQSPAGHRLSIHNGSFREVGVGVANGVNGGVGPQLVTQDFATASGSTPFVTGAAYYDFNGNNFYDLGEGIGGVTVTVSGANYYAVTANSGGYSVPVPGNGTYTVSFSAANLPVATRTAQVSGSKNVKVDFTPIYSAATPVGPVALAVGRANAFSFPPVGAATGYQWKASRRLPFGAVEGAENGLNNVLVAASPGYAVVVSNFRAGGSYSFHLAHAEPKDQTLTLNRVLRPSSNSQLGFASRLSWATGSQVARAQISRDGGVQWETVWSQAGTGSGGDSGFVTRTVPLSSFAGQEIMIRFVYGFSTGSYYSGASPGVGLYLDDIAVSHAEELVNPVMNAVAGTSFDFTPMETGNYAVSVRAILGQRTLNWGPAFLASASSAPIIRMLGGPAFAGGRVHLNFTAQNGLPGIFQVETAPTALGPWAVDPSATIETIVAGSQFRANASLGHGPACFYRVVAR